MIQLFILLLLVDCIFSGGKFLQLLSSAVEMGAVDLMANCYTLALILLFMLVLWRHYQLC